MELDAWESTGSLQSAYNLGHQISEMVRYSLVWRMVSDEKDLMDGFQLGASNLGAYNVGQPSLDLEV